jgi:solute carrier family 44 protein 1 (choline transporter-like protein)
VLDKVIQQFNEQANFAKYFAEIQSCWQTMAIMGAGTIFIAVVYIFLLKWITKPILYVSMFIILLMFILLGGWSWLKKDDYEPESDDYKYAQYGAYVSWGIAAIYLLFMCCCWKNISLGASIMEAASDFVSQNLRVVLLPVIGYCVCVPFIVYWIVTAVYLYSIGEPEF